MSRPLKNNELMRSMLGSFKFLIACATILSIFTASYVLDDRPYSSANHLVKYCSAIMWPVVRENTYAVPHGGRGNATSHDMKKGNLLSMSLLPAERPLVKDGSNGKVKLSNIKTLQQNISQKLPDKVIEKAVKPDLVTKRPDTSQKKVETHPEKKSNAALSRALKNESPPDPDNKTITPKKAPLVKAEVNLTPSPNSKLNPQPMPGNKYIIYVCDSKVYCFGLGDRQRAIAGLYLLAVVTNRKFGLIMTDPSPFTDLYEPNEVQWIIPDSELKGKSSKELLLFGRPDFNISTMDFNKKYPEDVIYVRSNFDMFDLLPQNPLYKDHLPQVPRWHLYSYAWTKLVSPTDYLREALNTELKKIVVDMNNEFEVFKKFDHSRCDMDCNNKNATKNCIDLEDTRVVLEDSTPNFCLITPPKIHPRTSPKLIMALRGHATVDIDLVCVHVRLGKTATFFWEKKSRNKAEDLPAIWDFVQPYVDKGHHVYVATDAQEVRDVAKAKFGHRMHVSPQPIVHIAKIQEGQDKKEGFRLAAMEQLMMSTSCKVLVISFSNLSFKAAMVRAQIHTEKDLYLFRNGKVVYFNPRRLF